jgi:hypothetical protein
MTKSDHHVSCHDQSPPLFVSSNDKGEQHHTALRIIQPFIMSFEDSNKCSGVPVMGSGGDNDSITGFDNIPAECNIHILQFLDVDDLANIAQVSRRFNENSLHTSLSQNRTATLTCVRRLDESTGTLSASPLPLLQKLSSKGKIDQYWRFNKVKIIGHNLLEKESIPQLRNMPPGSVGTLQHVRVLDLSFPSNTLKKTDSEVCIVTLLAVTMPCLREIDLSNVSIGLVAESALHSLASACPALEKITWNHHHYIAGMGMQGRALNACRCLKEIYMDDSTSLYQYSHLFRRCNTFLERVSLKNAKYEYTEPTQSSPQYSLVEFVRNTPTLRWFRSDLSPENVAILQAERPEVTFV